MPKVEKVRPLGRPRASPNGEGILDRIVPAGDMKTGIKLCVYGRGKTGKTRLACTFPKPLLLIGTEDGTKSVRGVSSVDFARIGSTEEFGQLVTAFLAAPGGKYRTVVLDTAGGLQDLVTKELLGLDEIPVQRSWGMTDMAGWGAIGSQTKEWLRRLLEPAERYGYHIVVIAHERVFGGDESGGGGDVLQPSVGAALSPKTTGWLNAAVDYLGQCFIREQKVWQAGATKGKDGKPVKVRKATGRKEYCLRVGPHEVYHTGFRVPPGTVVPDDIVDPTYEKVAVLIEGKTV